MPLIAKEYASLATTAEWITEDVKEFEKYLSNAGKGEEGSYEHFNLGQAIFHLKTAKQYLDRMQELYSPKNPNWGANDGPQVFETNSMFSASTPKQYPIKKDNDAEIKDQLSIILGDLLKDNPDRM